VTEDHESADLSVVARLEHLCALAAAAGAATVAHDAHTLLERVREGRFFVACLGQFKRGKSTLINALLGQELLPAGVAPVTSVVTVVRFGERRARVRVGADEWHDVAIEALSDYVSEAQNPENRKGVTGVEVFCRSAFLEHGLCLVDTPGISSVFSGNTRETQDFVPHIDAAIVVLGGDPPISGDELTLLESVSKRVSDVLLVLNKVDRLSERETHEARAFTESIIAQRIPELRAPVYEVSALERLEARGPDRQWPALLAHIRRLSEVGGAAIVERAAARGVAVLSARLRRHLTERRDALTRPVEESEQRLVELRRCAAEAEQAWIEVSHLFNAEQQRMGIRFERARTEFLKTTTPELAQQLQTMVTKLRTGTSSAAMRELACEQARELAERAVRSWMAAQTPLAEREFAAATERFVGHANAFLKRLRTSSELAADALPALLSPEQGLKARSRFFFVSMMRFSSTSPVTWVGDMVRSEASVRLAATRRGVELLRRLLEINASRFLGDLDDRFTESRRGVERALMTTLQEISGTAEQASLHAHAVRAQGQDAIDGAVRQVDDWARQLELICPLQARSVE